MADAPFDRVNIGFGERPVSDDLNRLSAQMDRTIRSVFEQLFSARASNESAAPQPKSGAIGAGFRVVPSSPAGMSVKVSAGLGMHYLSSDTPTDIGSPDFTGVDDLATSKPLVLLTDQTFVVPTAPGGGDSRIDIIEVRADRRMEDPTSRRKLNEVTGAFDPYSFDKTLSFTLDGLLDTVSDPADSTEPISYKTGVADAAPTAPTTTAGYIKIAEINVGTGVTTIDEDDIVDRRPVLGVGGCVRCSVLFRLEFNGGGGGEEVNLLSVVAPPGFQVGVYPSSAVRGQATVCFLGGEIAQAVVGAQVSGDDTLLSPGDFVVTALVSSPANTPGGTFLGPVTSFDRSTVFPGSVPVLHAGLDQQRVQVTTNVRYQASGTTSNTSAELEDLTFHVWADLIF